MGFTVATEALETLRQQPFDVILTDLMMPVMDGVSVVQAALEIDPNLASIIMTGHASVDTAVNALKTGAMDYVQKPFKLGEIVPVLTRALERRRLRMENLELREMVALHQLSVSVALAGDQTRVLERVADAAMTQTHAAAVWVLLAAEEPAHAGTVLRVAAARGESAPPNLRLDVSAELRAWAARAATDFETATPLGGTLPAGFTVPMIAGGQLAGLIHCRPAGYAGQLTAGQKRGMNILAATAGSAFLALAATKQLRAAEARYRLLAEEAPDVVCHFELRPRRAMTFVNPAVFSITGYKPEQFYADPDLILQIVHPEDRAAAETVWRGEEPASDLLTVRWITQSGSEVWVEQRSRLLRDSEGNIVAVEAVSRDVTERKALEERLRHAQRLEAIGTLTSGIAHDFNNLLTVINGFSALAAQEQVPGSLAGSRIHEIQEAGKQAAAITSQLLAFGRPETDTAAPHREPSGSDCRPRDDDSFVGRYGRRGEAPRCLFRSLREN
jgi:PAS domain S-box-containing protein